MSRLRRAFLVLALAGGATSAVHGDVLGQVARPPAGGQLDRFLAPPAGLEQDFVGTWNLSWDDPGDPNCPCRGTLTIQVDQGADNAGGLKGYWALKGGDAVLTGAVAFDNNLWAGRFAQPDEGVDFPLKGHFRLEARGGSELTGSYQRDGRAIPLRWSATRH